MVMIASLHLYANETDSMDDSIEALHELTHFFYSKLTPIYGIVRECTENTVFSVTMRKSAMKLGIKTKTAAQGLSRVVHLINMLLKDNLTANI